MMLNKKQSYEQMLKVCVIQEIVTGEQAGISMAGTGLQTRAGQQINGISFQGN